MKKDRKKIWREKNPMKAAYQTLKYNAKRRGKEFDLTFEQFKEFAIKTEYINKRGKNKDSYHIDRIDENKGYTIDNIQVLTNTKNLFKYIEFKQRNPDGTVEFTMGNNIRKEIIYDIPF